MKILSILLASTFGNNCNRPCPMNIDDVCGSDGETYVNLCLLENEMCNLKKVGINLVLAYNGECVHNHEKCKLGCTRDYNPVCILNGEEEQTFSNECEFKREICVTKSTNMVFLRNGSCTHSSL